MNRKDQRGFTIIELLIATLVFTVLLLVCLEGVARIGKMYYKAITTSKTNNLVRGMSDEFAQQLQYGGEAPGSLPADNVLGGTVQRFCFGDFMYRVVMNRPLNDSNPNILRRARLSGASCPTDPAVFDTQVASSGVELALKNMRVTKLSVVSDGDHLWRIKFRVAVGDEDQLNFNGADHDVPAVYQDAACISGAGSEYCATAQSETVVMRRIID